jgi:hypothetical protein
MVYGKKCSNLAEGSGFELSVPVQNWQTTAFTRRLQHRDESRSAGAGIRKIADQRTVSTAGGVVRLIDQKSSARSAGKALRMIFVNALLNGGDAQLTPTGGAGGTAGLVVDLGHFVPGLRGIIHKSLELGGRGMRGSGG